jgi:hypothetical protein
MHAFNAGTRQFHDKHLRRQTHFVIARLDLKSNWKDQRLLACVFSVFDDLGAQRDSTLIHVKGRIAEGEFDYIR